MVRLKRAIELSTNDRPAIVDEKTRIGDGEVDLMIGGHGGGAC